MSALRPTLYFSVDIEADGATPVVNSMLSFGLVIFDATGKEINKLQMNLVRDETRQVEARCKAEFWDKQKDAWDFVNKDQRDPKVWATALAAVFELYRNTHRIVWIADPAAYDWQWIKGYYDEFKPENAPDIGYSAKCIGTLFSVYCRLKSIPCETEDYYETEMRKKLEEPDHMAHNPEHDARVQGRFFFVLCKELRIAI